VGRFADAPNQCFGGILLIVEESKLGHSAARILPQWLGRCRCTARGKDNTAAEAGIIREVGCLLVHRQEPVNFPKWEGDCAEIRQFQEDVRISAQVSSSKRFTGKVLHLKNLHARA